MRSRIATAIANMRRIARAQRANFFVRACAVRGFNRPLLIIDAVVHRVIDARRMHEHVMPTRAATRHPGASRDLIRCGAR
jgi:hypothetical protein